MLYGTPVRLPHVFPKAMNAGNSIHEITAGLQGNGGELRAHSLVDTKDTSWWRIVHIQSALCGPSASKMILSTGSSSPAPTEHEPNRQVVGFSPTRRHGSRGLERVMNQLMSGLDQAQVSMEEHTRHLSPGLSPGLRFSMEEHTRHLSPGLHQAQVSMEEQTHVISHQDYTRLGSPWRNTHVISHQDYHQAQGLHGGTHTSSLTRTTPGSGLHGGTHTSSLTRTTPG